VKLIDFHLHVGTRQNFNPWIIEYFSQQNPYYTEHFADSVSPERLISYLETQQVERAVVLSEYAPKATGVVTNEFTAEFCHNHGQLIPFGSLCLYSDQPLAEQAEYALRDLGVKGFKLLPTYAHFYPNDSFLFPFYEVCRDHGVPVQCHTGTSIFRGSRVKYGDPLFLDDVADEFPRLKIVLEHGGRPFWYDRAAWMLTRHANVYIGIAGIPAKRLLHLFPKLESYPDRFIFGSDWPGVPDVFSYAERITRLPLSSKVIDMILYYNAKELLGLQ
jgi:hypothetical protein